MTKLVAIDNRTGVEVSLVNAECAADNRPIPVGLILTLGQKSAGVDIPAYDAKARGAHVIYLRYTTLAGREESQAFCMDGNTLYGLDVNDGTIISLTKTDGGGDGVKMTIAEHGEVTWCNMDMPALSVPMLVGIENGLPYYLRFANLETSADDVLFVAPGAYTPVTGQYGKGADIPECTDAGDWAARRMNLAGDPKQFIVRIFRSGYDIYYSIGVDDSYPLRLSPIPGGHSQGDGTPKVLTVRGETDITMQDQPMGFGRRDKWINDPITPTGLVSVHADVELMGNYREDASGNLVAFNSFVTRIAFRDDNNTPILGVKVALLASQPRTVDIDGQSYPFAGPTGTPVEVPLGATGSITITEPAVSIGSPVYRIVNITHPDGKVISSDVVDIHPADKIGAKLASLKTEEDWAGQKAADGSPLFDKDKETLAGGAEGVALMLSAAHETFDDATTPYQPTAFRGRKFARVRAASQPLDSRPRLARLEGRCWGMSVGTNGPIFHTQAEARAHLDSRIRVGETHTTTGDETSFWDWLGSLWDGMTKFFLDIVDGIATFVIHVGEAIYDFVVAFVSEIFDAIGWVLEKVFGLTTEKVVAWLGTLFDWTDIQATYRGLLTFSAGAVDSLEAGLTALPGQLQNVMSWLKAKPDLGPVAAIIPAVTSRASNQSNAGHEDEYAGSPALSWTQAAVANNYQAAKLSGGDLTDTLSALLGEFEAEAEQIYGIFSAAFTTISANFETMSVADILQTLIAAAGDSLVTVVDLLCRALAKVSSALVSALRTLLDAEIEVPLLSMLFHEFVDPKGKSTLTNLFTMLVAIPTTVLFKQFAGRAPSWTDEEVHLAAAVEGASVGSRTNVSVDAQVALGMATGFCQFIGGAILTGIEVNRCNPTPNTPVIRKLLYLKVAVDSLGYIFSVTATGSFYNSKKTKTARLDMDIFLAAWQVVYRVKDLARAMTLGPTGPRGIWFGLFESLAAIVYGFILLPNLGLQGMEKYENTVPLQTQSQFDQLLAGKCVNTLCLGVSQALSFPRELLREATNKAEAAVATNPDPATFAALALAVALEGSLIAIRLTLFTLVVPASNFWRNYVSLQVSPSGRRQSVVG